MMRQIVSKCESSLKKCFFQKLVHDFLRRPLILFRLFIWFTWWRGFIIQHYCGDIVGKFFLLAIIGGSFCIVGRFVFIMFFARV